MNSSDISDSLKRFEIPGRVTVMEGNGELMRVEVKSAWSAAEIYLHGAQVTGFQKNGEPPLLFLSQCSRFEAGHPIRGGIPVIFPWFGAREDLPFHGFARLIEWELHETAALPEGGVTLRFSLPDSDAAAMFPPFTANYVVTVTDRLELELILTNASSDERFSLENCLHTYFQIGDISRVRITGLEGLTYLDKVESFVPKQEKQRELAIGSEVDRIYLDATGSVEISDGAFKRRIRVEKSGSASTVVWNPWKTRSQQMPDFGNDEYLQMVCVESGNVSRNQITLAPGESSSLKVAISSERI
jgi:glucose-6-phosphate 1-epimerase